MPLMNKLFTMMSQTCLKSEKSNFKSFRKKKFPSDLSVVKLIGVCVCVCVCEQTEGDVLAGSS